jgi:hypothetical protein
MHRRTLGALLAAVAIVAAVAAEALIELPPNRLTNPHFDDTVVAWTGGGQQVTWAAGVDADGDPQSGAMRIAVNGEAGAVRGASTCVRITGGEGHVFGASYLIPVGQIPSGEVITIVSWYDDRDCVQLMDADAIPSTQDHGVVGTWTQLLLAATPPVNADSARLELEGWKLVGQEEQPDLIVYFDDALLLPEADGASVAATALAAIALRRRTRRTT